MMRNREKRELGLFREPRKWHRNRNGMKKRVEMSGGNLSGRGEHYKMHVKIGKVLAKVQH